jgi:hypothetical protein
LSVSPSNSEKERAIQKVAKLVTRGLRIEGVRSENPGFLKQ